MAKKIIMICDICLSRNYKTSKKENCNQRLELNKYCKNCNCKTLHKESK